MVTIRCLNFKLQISTVQKIQFNWIIPFWGKIIIGNTLPINNLIFFENKFYWKNAIAFELFWPYTLCKYVERFQYRSKLDYFGNLSYTVLFFTKFYFMYNLHRPNPWFINLNHFFIQFFLSFFVLVLKLAIDSKRLRYRFWLRQNHKESLIIFNP